jgi:hypothetical protein
VAGKKGRRNPPAVGKEGRNPPATGKKGTAIHRRPAERSHPAPTSRKGRRNPSAVGRKARAICD